MKAPFYLVGLLIAAAFNVAVIILTGLAGHPQELLDEALPIAFATCLIMAPFALSSAAELTSRRARYVLTLVAAIFWTLILVAVGVSPANGANIGLGWLLMLSPLLILMVASLVEGVLARRRD